MMLELYLLLCYLSVILCFNVDIDNVVNIKEADGSHFGYSALMFINDNGEKWAVIGATRANFTTHALYDTPGNVYKCRLNFTQKEQDACIAMNLEQTDNVRWPDSPGYEEDKELLGATMAMIDDTIVTCAPLWKNYIPHRSNGLVHPLGRCFNVDKRLSSYDSNPFKKTPLAADTGSPADNSQFFFEFAQIGFSISSRKYENSLFPVLLGAPGLTENIGGFLRYEIKPANKELFYNAFTRVSFENENIFSFGDLLGYAITTGNVVNGSKCSNVVVVGSPHFTTSDGIVGSVFIICATVSASIEKSEILKQFFGRKSGGGFGSSLVFNDINGDGLDDLLVGEPMYFNQKNHVLDVGTVSIYYGSNDSSVTLEKSGQELNGIGKENGRFGTSMECIGDINKDRFNDIVISAPYENDLKGAIYVYHGGKSALTLAQRITPEDIGMELHSFGWYISTAYDIDNNQYPDFLVGSYMSDTVSIFRTRPIIILNSMIDTLPNIIPLNSSGQLCEDQYFRPCVSVQLCFTYSGEFVPEKIRIYYNMSADVDRTRALPSKPSRVSFLTDGESNQTVIHGFVEVTKENGSCVLKSAIVQTLDREFYASLEEELVFEAGFELTDMPVSGEVQPIIQNNIVTVKQTSANFSTGCNNTCHPNLHIDTQLDAHVLFLADVSEIVLKVHISNTGDQSYGTRLLIDYSNNTEYIAYSQPQGENTELIFCEKVADADNNTSIECNMKTTFYQNQIVAVLLRFAVSRSLLIQENRTLDNFNQYIDINSVVQSTTRDADDRDNKDTVSAIVKLKSAVEVSGLPLPDQLLISDQGVKSLVFTHTYNIFNHGPSPLTDYNIKICIPVTSTEGQRLILKENIKVKTRDSELTWKIVQYPEEHSHISTNDILNTTEMTTPMELSTTATMNVENSTMTISPYDTSSVGNIQQTPSLLETPEKEQIVTEKRGKLKFNVITCERKPDDRLAIIEVHIGVLKENKGLMFELPFNLSESLLDFKEVYGVIFKTSAELSTRNDDRYITTSHNTSYNILYASTEIYGREKVAVEVKKISIWIIIGSSVGGLALLVMLFIILKKCGFFERKKREDVKKFKRQSGYYAARQSRVSMISAKVKSANWETLNNDYGKEEKKDQKLVTIKE